MPVRHSALGLREACSTCVYTRKTYPSCTTCNNAIAAFYPFQDEEMLRRELEKVKREREMLLNSISSAREQAGGECI